MALQVISEPTTFTGGLSANNFPISVGGGVTTSSTAPSSPSAGDLWFNTENGNLYIYYNDGNSQQWVAADNSGSGGKVAQVVVASTNIPATTTLLIPIDDTIPQNTEGAEFITATITPTNASSNLIIEFEAWCSASAANTLTFALFRDSDADAIQTTGKRIAAINIIEQCRLKYIVSAGSTSARTYKIRYGPVSAGTGSILRAPTVAPVYGDSDSANFTITEILP